MHIMAGKDRDRAGRRMRHRTSDCINLVDQGAEVLLNYRSEASSVGNRGITANAVLPGGTDTDMMETPSTLQRENSAHASAMKRLGRPA